MYFTNTYVYSKGIFWVFANKGVMVKIFWGPLYRVILEMEKGIAAIPSALKWTQIKIPALSLISYITLNEWLPLYSYFLTCKNGVITVHILRGQVEIKWDKAYMASCL